MEQATDNTSDSGNKKKIAITVLTTIIVVGGLITLFYLRYKAHHISTDDAFVEGTIHTVSAKVSGTVKGIYVTDNQFVKEGQLLVELDDTDYALHLKESEAALSAERAKAGEADSRLDAAKGQLYEHGAKTAIAQANVALSEANLKQAQLDIKRAENLYKDEAISKEKYERAQTNYTVLTAAKNSALEQLRQAELAVKTQQSVIKQTEALQSSQLSSIKQKEALAEEAAHNLSYTKVYAPASGYVNKKSVETGNRIQVGQPLMAIVALDDIWVVANYKETQVAKIRPGQQVEVSVDAYPGKIFNATVDSIMAGTGSVFSLFPPENASGHYVKVLQRIPVKIVLDNTTVKEHVLRVGMSVVPTVIVK
ncbi:MAG: HlyD family secretion protein [Nitrospirae bacterium]|nr:HlyD family secretion protein [Nitrospirota bacterium]MBF0533867.1 HlyD family secretion protein [Nitrospirota bacterium]MBF0615424.1 HlyD family secretion protein [Nitrospirota bacterium]